MRGLVVGFITASTAVTAIAVMSAAALIHTAMIVVGRLTLLAWLGFVDDQGPTVHFTTIECIDGFLRFIFTAHLNKRKSPRFAGQPVQDKRTMGNIAHL